MKDLHYDGAFARAFSQASKNWSWATWHQVEAAQDAAALRLLEEVFGPRHDETDAAADDARDEGE
ncbi:MAG TPA: hypothetical protein VFU63_10985 [Ktedonobacterales bacterium]|nr:hypothetical protein [Ktedonobacterales bacterium]